MLPEEQKEVDADMEKLTKSQYFDFLVKEQIKLKIRDLITQNKWYFAVVLGLLSTIVVIAGLEFLIKKSEIDKQFDHVNAQIAISDSVLKIQEIKVNSLIGNASGKFDSLEESAVSQFNSISQSTKLSTDLGQQVIKYQTEFFREQFDAQLKSVSEELKKMKDVESNLDSKMEKIDYWLRGTEYQLKRMTEIKDSLINVIDELKPEVYARYLFVQRGNNEPGGIEYRPASIELPTLELTDSVFIMTVVFLEKGFKEFTDSVFVPGYGDVEKADVKRAKIKVIVAEKYRKTKPIVNIIEVMEGRAEMIWGTRYMIEPLFIYLPPNIGRIPDFIMLKIWQGK